MDFIFLTCLNTVEWIAVQNRHHNCITTVIIIVLCSLFLTIRNVLYKQSYFIILIILYSLQYSMSNQSVFPVEKWCSHPGQHSTVQPVQSEFIWQVATRFISRGPLGTDAAVLPFTVCLLTALRPGWGSAVRSTRGVSGWQTTGCELRVSAFDSRRNRYNISQSLPLTVYSIWQSLSVTRHLTQRFTVYRTEVEAWASVDTTEERATSLTTTLPAVI